MSRRPRGLARLVNATIEAFNNWLASERGFVQAVILTAIWTAAAIAGVDQHGFLFLFFATAISFVTQFNLALIGRRSGVKLDQALEQLTETTATLLQLAKNESDMQEALIAQTEAIAAALELAKPKRRR